MKLFLFTAIGFLITLGLNDRNEEQGYQWSDKSPVTYINWQHGQPNDAHQTQNCVVMYNRDGKWSDYYCSFRHTFICKRSLGRNLFFLHVVFSFIDLLAPYPKFSLYIYIYILLNLDSVLKYQLYREVNLFIIADILNLYIYI